jgi:hypothetical protein
MLQYEITRKQLLEKQQNKIDALEVGGRQPRHAGSLYEHALPMRLSPDGAVSRTPYGLGVMWVRCLATRGDCMHKGETDSACPGCCPAGSCC